MTRREYTKKYKTSWELIVCDGYSHQFGFCCGLIEVRLAPLKNNASNWSLRRLKDYLSTLITDFDNEAKAGLIISDNCNDSLIHKLLSQIVKPKYMGKNIQDSGNKIYLWAIPYNKLIK